MMVTCDRCGKIYNDARRWTICPHNELEGAPLYIGTPAAGTYATTLQDRSPPRPTRPARRRIRLRICFLPIAFQLVGVIAAIAGIWLIADNQLSAFLLGVGAGIGASAFLK